jgi:hypothetical protein
MVFNATFNNILAISWRSVLLVEETGVPGENHHPIFMFGLSLNISYYSKAKLEFAQDITTNEALSTYYPIGPISVGVGIPQFYKRVNSVALLSKKN